MSRQPSPGMSPEARLAHKAVTEARIAGVLVRPDVCEACGRDTEHWRMDAHHEDYAKPLAVIWLCRSCHVRHHAELRRKKAA